MKNSLLKWSLLAFFLVSDFVVFAQTTTPVSDGQGEGGTEGDDTPPTPINGKLVWLAILGIAFAYTIYAKAQRDKKTV